MLIYKVTSLINGMTYIGQTNRSIEERWKEHCKPALRTRSYLSNAIQKYGKENFKIEELAKASSQEELDLLEDKVISELNTLFPNGYNLRHGGMGGKLSDEAKVKVSKASKGRVKSAATKEKLRKANIGRPNINARPVIGTNIKTGEIIRLKNPMAMPERFHYNCVHRCAKGERKQHKGFTWKYE